MNEIRIVFGGPSDSLYFYLAGLILMAVLGYFVLAFPDDHPETIMKIKALFKGRR